MVLFATFLTLGVVNRRKPASHKRLMLLASISLLGAPIARIPLMFPLLPIWLDAIVYTAFTVAMGYWDFRTRGRVRPETLYGGQAIVFLTLAALPIGSAAAWQNTCDLDDELHGAALRASAFHPKQTLSGVSIKSSGVRSYDKSASKLPYAVLQTGFEGSVSEDFKCLRTIVRCRRL